MVHYRRSRVAGGTFFFTVNLRDRRRTLLVEHADAFRGIVRGVKTQFPFVIDVMVVMPDHWHAVWTLLPGDNDFAHRLRLIKARFTRHLVKTGVRLAKDTRGDYDLWQKRFWEHAIRDDRDFEAHVNHVHINPVKRKGAIPIAPHVKRHSRGVAFGTIGLRPTNPRAGSDAGD